MTARKDCTESTSRHFRRIAPAVFRAAWLDRSRLLSDLSKEFGLSARAMRERAKAMGLPVRQSLGRELSIKSDDEATFIMLYRAGVGAPEIARHFGMSLRCVAATRDRLGLDLRPLGWKPTTTITAFMEERLAALMSRHARIEQAAFINAELVDRVADNNWVGIKHARGQFQ